jgi:hypothetical protein
MTEVRLEVEVLLEHDCRAEWEAEPEPQQERKRDYFDPRYFDPSDDGFGYSEPGRSR